LINSYLLTYLIHHLNVEQLNDELSQLLMLVFQILHQYRLEC